MFYSKLMFVKKGALSKVWMAAHCERKLKKQHVEGTDISLSAETISNPDTPLALRLSGQLLLGLVRIYSRKVSYLQEDCKDAVTKIKVTFRPGAVDLKPEDSIAPSSAITLPDLALSAGSLSLDLDLSLPDLPMHLDQLDALLAQDESVLQIELSMDGGLGGVGVGGAAADMSMDMSLDLGAGAGAGLGLDMGLDLDLSMAQRARARRSSVNMPDDNKEAFDESLDLLSDSLQLQFPDDQLEGLDASLLEPEEGRRSMLEAEVGRREMPLDEGAELGLLDNNDSFMGQPLGTPARVKGKDSLLPHDLSDLSMLPEQESVLDESVAPVEDVELPPLLPEGDLKANADEGEGKGAERERARRKPKRRAGVEADERTELTSEFIKAMLADRSDIIVATRPVFKRARVSLDEAWLRRPAVSMALGAGLALGSSEEWEWGMGSESLMAPELMAAFINRPAAEAEAEEEEEEKEEKEAKEKQQQQDREKDEKESVAAHPDAHDQDQSLNLDLDLANQSLNLNLDLEPLPGFEMEMAGEDLALPEVTSTAMSMSVPSLDEEEEKKEEDRPSYDLSMQQEAGVDTENIQEQEDSFFGAQVPKGRAELKGEGFTARTRKMHALLSQTLKNDKASSVSLFGLLDPSSSESSSSSSSSSTNKVSRAVAAAAFYELLVLGNRRDILTLQQDEPYGDIIVTPQARFQSVH